MDAELTPERQDRLTEAGYVVDTAPGQETVRGRLRVRDGAGHPFDLELVALPDGAREAFVAHLSRWFTIIDSDVERLVDALDLDDVIGYLTAPAAPSTLETFVEVEGKLGAGHTSTILVTLGRTLARLHAQGVEYGPMRTRDVLVVDGRVVLTVPKPDLARPPTLASSPQEDAYHLAALADSVIEDLHGPRAPLPPPPGLRGLARLIISAMGDAADRPGVGTLATLSHDLAPCLPLVPLEQVAAMPAASPRTGDGRRSLDRPAPRRKAFRGGTRTVMVLVLCAGVVGLGAAAVVHRTAGAPASAVAIEDPAAVDPAAEDPGAAAARLTRTRMDRVVALTNGVTPAEDTWADVLVPGSAAHTQTSDLVARLRADGSQITGLSVETEPPVVLAQAPGTAQVEVTFAISAYRLVSTGGVQEVPAGGPRTAVLDLVRSEAGWLVAAVSEVEPAS